VAKNNPLHVLGIELRLKGLPAYRLVTTLTIAKGEVSKLNFFIEVAIMLGTGLDKAPHRSRGALGPVGGSGCPKMYRILKFVVDPFGQDFIPVMRSGSNLVNIYREPHYKATRGLPIMVDSGDAEWLSPLLAWM
jgi:hypothetical protein